MRIERGTQKRVDCCQSRNVFAYLDNPTLPAQRRPGFRSAGVISYPAPHPLQQPWLSHNCFLRVHWHRHRPARYPPLQQHRRRHRHARQCQFRPVHRWTPFLPTLSQAPPAPDPCPHPPLSALLLVPLFAVWLGRFLSALWPIPLEPRSNEHGATNRSNGCDRQPGWKYRQRRQFPFPLKPPPIPPPPTWLTRRPPQ